MKDYVLPYNEEGNRMTKDEYAKNVSYDDDFQWEDELKKKLEELGYTFDELFKTQPFHWTEVTVFLKSAIMVAEEFYPDDGPAKLQLVMAIWDYYDGEYELVKKIGDWVDFREIMGNLIGTIVEQFDHVIIRALIEQFLIPALVALIFPKEK